MTSLTEWALRTESRRLALQIFRVFLPSRKHGREIIPAMQNDHDEVSQKEEQNRPHHRNMPDAGPVKTAHHPGQPGKLHRLPHRQPGHYGKNAQSYDRSVRQLLQRVVNLADSWLRSEEKVVVHH